MARSRCSAGVPVSAGRPSQSVTARRTRSIMNGSAAAAKCANGALPGSSKKTRSGSRRSIATRPPKRHPRGLPARFSATARHAPAMARHAPAMVRHAPGMARHAPAMVRVDRPLGGWFPLQAMTTRARAARLFVTGLAPGGVGLTPEFERLLRETPPAGVLLFRRDFRELTALPALVQRMRALAAPAPLLVCVDEEGGFVSQVAPDVPVPPSARVLGRGATARQVESLGEFTGRVLRAHGVDVDFAPVFDVDAEPTNPVIGPRAFGSDPATVSRLGLAFARGLTTGGVVPC